MGRKGGRPRNDGIDNGNSQLSELEVVEIYVSPDSTRNTAKAHNISHVTVSNIRCKKSWKKITDHYDEVQKYLRAMESENASDNES